MPVAFPCFRLAAALSGIKQRENLRPEALLYLKWICPNTWKICQFATDDLIKITLHEGKF